MLARLFFAILTALLASAVFFFALGLARRLRLMALLGLAFPILLTPLWIPAKAPFLRFLAAVHSVMLVAKLWDIHFGIERRFRPKPGRFVLFLLNQFSIVLRKLDNEPRPGLRENAVHLARSLLGLALGCVVLRWLFQLDWEGLPFALEHAAKVIGFYLALLPGVATAVALWRLSGARARDVMDQPYLARTPADFWRRYNRPMQQFFYEDIFKPCGGLRSPVAALCLVFAISAILHEYVFGIATGRIQGYQTAFFLLQGCAVILTMRIRPRRLSAIPWIAGTALFNLASSVLFFASMNGVVPIYSRGLPTWLQW